MELNREQIIKALEYCTDTKYHCEDCPYFYKSDGLKSSMEILMTDALSLIKELTEENERLRAENAKYEAENNAQFDKWLILEEATKKRYHELFEEATIVVKEDTVRKMQERLKQVLHEEGRSNYYLKATIDQIAKEMVEGVIK